MNTNTAVRSNSQAPPKYDLQELKRQVGVRPFEQRLHFDDGGFSKCPFHQGDGDTTFHLKMTEDGAVIGTCFSECNKTFDAIDFVKKFDGVQTAEAIRKLAAMVSEHGEAPTTILHKPKPASPMTAAIWAKVGRAVTDADAASLSASRPGSVTPSAATFNALGFKMAEMHGQTFITAPYRLGDEFFTIKARNILSKDFINENSVSQKGLFNIDAVTPGCDVYVVESELDAAVLHEAGFIAVSVINAKQQQLEPEVVKKLLTAYRIFLVGDQDAPGQICMDNIARLLPSEKVYRMELPDVKDVGELAKVAQQNDVDAFLLGDFKDRWNAARKDSMASWVTHNIPFAYTIEAKPMEWTVDKMLPYGGLLLFAGKYGAYKSLWALFMAAGIESGTSVFGRKVLRKIPVLYVDRENHQQTVGERRMGIGLPDNAVRYWGDWLENYETPKLDDPRLAEFAIREKGVIVFDSLTDWLEDLNENDPSAMTKVMRQFRRLARFGAGVILLHHADKYHGTARGTTAIVAAADMAMKAEKVKGMLRITEDKFRMCGTWEMDVKFDFKGQYTYQVVRDESQDSRTKTESDADVEMVRGLLAGFHDKNKGAGMSQTQLVKSIQAFGVSRDRARDMISEGVRNNRWRFEGGTRNSLLYSLTGWTPEEAV
jgi:AAA domain/Toprim-like